jgi:hypothetical protein
MWAIALFIFSSYFALAQQTTQFPNLPPSVVGPQLVAWSDLQKPLPLPPAEQAGQSQPNRLQVQPAQPPVQLQPSSACIESHVDQTDDGNRYEQIRPRFECSSYESHR